MKPTFANDLERFIYEKCYDFIWDEVSRYVSEHPASLELIHCRLDCPDEAAVEDMSLEFSTNIVIDEDTLSFDAVVSCTLTLEQETHHDRESCDASQWFKVSCSVDVKERLRGFAANGIEVHSGFKKKPPVTGVTASGNIVPRIYPDGLDAEATKFLSRYCPEALRTPMAVPIEDIVKEKMGLTLTKGGRLTDDFSIFGQICFSQGKVKVYDISSGKEHDLEVERGTILIDAYTYWERNLGCVNNTIAHEAYHWFRHRVYAAIKSILKGEKFIACRCPAKGGDEKKGGEWTDEERMEWQANHIAPRILMPIQTVRPKIEDLFGQYDYYGNGADKTMILECVIDDLAEFYKVSKQSAKIRMVDLGYKEADGVYNFEGFAPYFSSISPRDAFYEYCDNEEFRSVVDSGLFRYADGYFVFDNERFIAKDADDKPALTEYARDNLDECALQFTYRRVDMRLHGQFHHDAFHRKNPDSYQKLPRYDADKNAALIANAAAFKAAFEEEYETVTATSKTFSQRVTELMERKGWDAHKFAEHTRLEPNNYYRILRGETENPSIETVLNICIGLDAPSPIREELIALAGRSWQKTQLHCAYQFILKKGSVCTVTDFNNAFALLEIESGGKPPLKDDI